MTDNIIEIIRAEIKRLKKNLPWGSCASQVSMECNCKDEAYNEILSFIDEVVIAKYIAELRRQEEIDLEKEVVSICETYGITKYLDAELGPHDIKNIARHFYELGQKTK